MSLDQSSVEVQTRKAVGKGVARKLRAAGKIPATLYAAGKEPVSMQLDPEALRKALKTAHVLNTVLTLKFDGGAQSRMALLKDWQSELTTSKLLHADFVEISLTSPIKVSVPLRYVGKAKGLARGGLVEVVRFEQIVQCLPKDIPTHIDIDVSGLDLGDAIHVADLQLENGVKAVFVQNFTLVSVTVPREEKAEATTAVAAEGAAPAADAKAADGKAPAAAAGKDAKAPAAAAAKPAAKPAAKK